jgi:hypothetical protein
MCHLLTFDICTTLLCYTEQACMLLLVI